MTRARSASVAAALAVLVLVPGDASSAPAPARIERISVNPDGSEIAAESTRGQVSDDGRHVVFESGGGDLVPDDTKTCISSVTGEEISCYDVFLLDRQTRAIERVSVRPDGTEANGHSYAAFMTPDARFIGFVSGASNLAPGDTNSSADVFLLDRQNETLERISLSSNEVQGDAGSPDGSDITPDGRFVAFWSNSINLVPGDTNARADVFVRDRLSGTTERVSVASGGVQSNGNSSEPAISDDGRFVAFKSYASNLGGLDPDASQFSDIYVHDRLTHQTENVSVSSDGEDGLVNAYRPDISGDGRFVVFDGEATNLVPSDTNGFGYDVYLHDRQTGRTEQVSVDSAGIQANDSSYNPSITPDGRYVSFVSEGTNMAPNDTGVCFQSAVEGNGSCRDVFIHDRVTGQTDRLTVPEGGAPLDGNNWNPRMSGDGRFVTYESAATTLLASGDGNQLPDVYLTDRGPSTGVGGLQAAPSDGSVAVSGWARFRGDAVVATDAAADAGPGARQAGTELIGARLAYRPEEGDLLARLELDRLPPTPRPSSAAQVRLASAPGIVYGMEITVGAARYELRATRGLRTREATASSFTLLRCAPTCAEVATLSGSIGTTGDHVNVTVPLSSLGAGAGTRLSGVRGFVGPGEAPTGAVTVLDDVRLPDYVLPAVSVRLGIAPAGTPPEDVVFGSVAGLAAGAFAGSLGTGGLPSGAYRVWARACLGETCGTASAPIDLP